jgi:hypothetical protein
MMSSSLPSPKKFQRKFSVLAGLLAVGLSVHAMAPAPKVQTTDTTGEQFCVNALNSAGTDLNYPYFNDRATGPTYRMGFLNAGGLFNGGVCWWNSGFTRNAIYLTLFRPELPKPTADQASGLIDQIAAGNQVVEVPGYADLPSFTRDYQDTIQSKFNGQQVDAIFNFGWLGGVDREYVPADLFSERMDATYKEVGLERKVAYYVLKLPGVVAHAWLMIDVQPTDNGYRIWAIDSNFLNTITWDYVRGSTNLGDYYGMGDFSPHLKNEDQFGTYLSSVKAFCSH